MGKCMDDSQVVYMPHTFTHAYSSSPHIRAPTKGMLGHMCLTNFFVNIDKPHVVAHWGEDLEIWQKSFPNTVAT